MVLDAIRLFLLVVAVIGGALSAGLVVLFLGLTIAREFPRNGGRGRFGLGLVLAFCFLSIWLGVVIRSIISP